MRTIDVDNKDLMVSRELRRCQLGEIFVGFNPCKSLEKREIMILESPSTMSCFKSELGCVLNSLKEAPKFYIIIGVLTQTAFQHVSYFTIYISGRPPQIQLDRVPLGGTIKIHFVEALLEAFSKWSGCEHHLCVWQRRSKLSKI
jgi:hypothetical protein